MRICRLDCEGQTVAAFYFDEFAIQVADAASAFEAATGEQANVADSCCLLSYLPGAENAEAAQRLYEWAIGPGEDALRSQRVDTKGIVRKPIPKPNKLFLLAGNYAKHIDESGGIAAEQGETFPYVFMKPATTLSDPDGSVRIPAISPNYIDWELELAIVIGREAKDVSRDEALSYVAGYTVVNDISNRKFRPNPERKEREKDKFFDWLHGKWHDSFCPSGPCIASTSSIPDPQQLGMQLSVNGQQKQDASTSQMVFPVEAIVEFVSSIVTLEPGDMISTGTPHGVGFAKNEYLRPGDQMEASIEGIGVLRSTVEAE